MILPGSDPAAIQAAAQALARGELVGLPTETVYGLGADADNPLAVGRVFAAKGRPSDHPLIVHVLSFDQVALFAAEVPDFAHRLMAAFWPGPLTLILPRRPGVAEQAAGGQATVGLRCPSHPVAQAVLQQALALGVSGVAAPSANRFGRVSPTAAAHVAQELGRDLLVLDGGACEVGIESTIVDCTRGAPVLLRPGQSSRAQITAACGQTVLDKESLSAPAPRASGTLASHYAPRAKVRLMSGSALQTALQALGVHANNLAVWSRSHPAGQDRHAASAGVLWRAMPQDAADAAQALFGLLRDFDARGAQQIWIETPPDTPEWEGVRDRLQRAAA
jgi:L-threonylcarbamoyladenylate synthase